MCSWDHSILHFKLPLSKSNHLTVLLNMQSLGPAVTVRRGLVLNNEDTMSFLTDVGRGLIAEESTDVRFIIGLQELDKMKE